ncbi:hypothetical protein BJ742DRAFT_774132 [Cladochytrium replicatum]|nr:hypothetical protein BJ742DRAFT_774132 [Cladochytrium replicatum]
MELQVSEISASAGTIHGNHTVVLVIAEHDQDPLDDFEWQQQHFGGNRHVCDAVKFYTIEFGASENGHRDVVGGESPSGLKRTKQSKDAVNSTSSHGNIDVLDWLLTLHCPCPSSEVNKAVYEARGSFQEHLGVEVLFWWKQSGIEMWYTAAAMDKASSAGHFDVRDWWIASGLPA